MTDERKRALRARILAGVSLLVVFIAGTLVGAAVDRGRHHGPRDRGGDRPGGSPAIFAAGGRMARELGLTPAQSDSIEGILTRDRARNDSLYRAMRPQLQARFDSTRAAVSAVLTPEQRVKLDSIFRERRERVLGERGDRGKRGRHGDRMRGGFGPPPPPPADTQP